MTQPLDYAAALTAMRAMVKPGEMLYRLANLESVWVYLDIYESELPWVQYGQMVETKSEAVPGQSFSGRVWFISPVLNEETRTIKGERMCFGTWLDREGQFFDTVHFPDQLAKAPFRGRGLYRIRGRLVPDFGFFSLEVMGMERLGYRT